MINVKVIKKVEKNKNITTETSFSDPADIILTYPTPEMNFMTYWNEYEEIFKNIQNGIIIFKPINNGENFIVQYCNPAIISSIPRNREKLIGKKITELFPKVNETGFLKSIREVNKTGKPCNFDMIINEDNKLRHWSENHLSKLSSDNILLVHNRITELKKYEELYLDTINNSEHAIAIFQKNHIKLINNKFSQITGYSPEEIYNMTPKDINKIFSENQTNNIKCLNELITGKEISKQKEFIFTHKNGEKRWLSCHSIRTNHNNQPAVQITLIDITERVKAQKELKKALAEKELLMREMNHRIKNNLQIIISLLSLQSNYETSSDPHEILRKTQSRIKSMALTHEKIYKSSDLEHINIKRAFNKFTEEIFNIYNVNKTITLNMDVEDLEIETDTLTPLLLIINELLTNTIKYAFPHNEKGTINLTLKSQENSLILTYSDNGIGIPETIDINNPKTLGLTLITSLTSQINGTLQLTKNPKTTYTITFKEQKYKKRT